MKTILVVDNHPLMLKFMRNLLENAGNEVASAADGLSALRILETLTPDVIFVDLVMPNISGEKLCRIIRSQPRFAATYLVVLSAIAAEERLDFSAFGANACIAKGPFHRMSEHVLEVLKRSDRPNESIEEIIGLEEVYQRDVTKELLISKRHAETILDHLSEGILELTRNGEVIYSNLTATSLIGLPEERLLGSDFKEVFQPSSRERVEELLEESRKVEGTVADDTTALLNEKQVSLTVLPVRREEQATAIVIIKDVTQQKRLESHLEHAQRMEAIATLAGGVAHQFNNALFAISGNLELLQMVMSDKEKVERYIEPIKPSLERMTDLTNQLLAYAREGKYKPEKIGMNEFVKNTVPLLRYAVGNAADISMDLSEDVCGVEVDLAQMQMVLSALIANATEAMGASGRIRVLTRNERVDDASCQGRLNLRPGRYVRLTVEDNGKGMEDKIKERIFEPFFTTKFQGRGLGMAAAYGIVSNHDGCISVESEAGRGTTVHIYLPAVERETERKGSESDLSQGAGTIMVIEDEETILDISKEMLEHLGYHILQARTAREAIKLAKTYKGPIDLAMLDIGLPDMEGHLVYPIIKKARPKMKVTVCSGYALDGHAKEILNSGAQGFIQKPYSLATLSAKLREVLDGR